MTKVVFLFLLLSVLCANAFAQDGTPVKLKGQIVCSECWFEAPNRKADRYGTAADIDCALDCAEKNIPQALAVEDEKGFTLYILEPGAYKPKGKDFFENVPAIVEIEGVARTAKNKHFLKVNSLKVLDEKPLKPKPVSDDAVLTLKDLSGAEQSLANYRGRVVVLNFWATWCVPCRKEMPDLLALQNDYAALGLQVIGAAGDTAADSAKVLKFIRDFKVNFPVWLGATTDDMKRFGVGEVLPATVIIDRSGKIVRREIGIIKPADLRSIIDSILLSGVKEAEKIGKAEKKKAKNASLVPA